MPLSIKVSKRICITAIHFATELSTDSIHIFLIYCKTVRWLICEQKAAVYLHQNDFNSAI